MTDLKTTIKNVKYFVLFLILPAALVIVVLFIHLDYIFTWRYSAEYEKYSSDFNTVKDYMLSIYSGEEEKTFLISEKTEENKLYLVELIPLDKLISGESSRERIEPPENVRDSIKKLKAYAFPDTRSTFNYLRVSKARVAFCIEGVGYALIYSPDKKPEWIVPSQKKYTKVRRIGNGWYHVAVRK